MNMHEMLQTSGKSRKRVGRGRSSGHGKTSGRGHNGQKSRTSNNIPVGFEGGQMPLKRRSPKARGFKRFQRIIVETVNLSEVTNAISDTSIIDKKVLFKARLIKDIKNRVKILGEGSLSRPVTIIANAFSSQAQEKIKVAGGKVEIIMPKNILKASSKAKLTNNKKIKPEETTKITKIEPKTKIK